MTCPLYIPTVTLLLAGFCLPAAAAAPNPISLETEATREKPLNRENLGLLHRDDAHPWLQEFWVLGRYHGHLYDAEGSDGDQAGFESRRIRLGFQARLFNRLSLHA